MLALQAHTWQVILKGILPAGVTLNQSLLENVLHSLLIDGRDHVVEMYQGSGSKWTKSRQVLPAKHLILPQKESRLCGRESLAPLPNSASKSSDELKGLL